VVLTSYRVGTTAPFPSWRRLRDWSRTTRWFGRTSPQLTLGAASCAQERQDQAIAAYERALALDARAAHVHYNLGLIYVERNDLLRASAHFHRALETDPNDRDARNWLEKIGKARDPMREHRGSR